MRTLIKQSDGYKVYVNILDLNEDHIHVSFEAEFEHAKTHDGVHRKFEMFLNQNEMFKLLNAIERYTW